jgi:CRP-like cAMP-binding protein
MELATFRDAALSPDSVLGHASYVLLIISMLMTRMLYLRLFAVAAGTCGIMYFVSQTGDFVSAGWEIAFVAVNVVQIGIMFWRNRRLEFSDDNWLFREQVAPSLDATSVRRLLATGEWRTAEPGHVFTEHGQMVSHLIFIADGEVQITVDGIEVGCCYRGSLVGEISILSGTPATATATALTPVRYLALERNALRKLIARERDVEQAIDMSFRKEFREKIASANEALVDAERRAAAGSVSRRRRPSPRSVSEAAPE